MRKKKLGAKVPTLEEIISEIRHYLPSQGPIKDFIHHNTLHAFQEHDNLSFHEAIRQASLLYGSNEYLPIDEYRQHYTWGKVTDQGIDFVLAREKDAQALRAAMFNQPSGSRAKRSGFRSQGYLRAIAVQCEIILEEQVHPIVFRLVANFLDQGIAQISLAEANGDFWTALRQQLSVARNFGLSHNASDLIQSLSPADLINLSLAKILPVGADSKVFLLEILMAARGWSGLISEIESRPQYLNYPRNISLMQYLALYIAVFSDILEQVQYNKSQIELADGNADFFSQPAPAETPLEKISRLWHDAMEMSFYFETLQTIRINAIKKRERSRAAQKAEFQTIFCIDDRECSLRRHLEEISDVIETFSTPGFFAIDAVYQGPFDAISIKQCPVPVTPRHRIRGVVDGQRGPGAAAGMDAFGAPIRRKRRSALSRMEMNFWHRHANNLSLGLFISLFFGLISLIRLIFSIHRPTRTFATASSFAVNDDQAELHYERPEGEAQKDGFFEGYTVSEMAERVGRVLRQIGLTHQFSPLVVLVGHGSSSTNNPYFAAYDCGACSGRPGFVNARAFALMANRDDVRVILKKEGLNIPVSTRFIGAIHDTARDEIIFLDEDDIMAQHSAQVSALKRIFAQALEKNAHERSRRFAIIDFPESTRKALKEARQRTEMLFEPRPEYNHATNALAIVGRRSLTENLFLDRRAFFNSYDPLQDKDGKILNGILTPLVPVCGGINLEYLFSRVDNTIFGAGSKLPHNVFALVGVGNGAEGDLRTGLPEQMIEIHDPLRLMILVEQKKEIVERVLNGNDAVRQWIEKEWVKFCVYDYAKKKFFWSYSGRLEELRVPAHEPRVYENSVAAYRNQRHNISPAVIKRSA